MNRYSLKVKFTIILVVMMIVLVGAILFANGFFAERYYTDNMKNDMIDSYMKVEGIVDEFENGDITKTVMNDRIETLTSATGISLIIVRSNWETFYASERQDEALKRRLEMSIFNLDVFPEVDVNMAPPNKGFNDNNDLSMKEKFENSDRIELNPVKEEREILLQTGKYTLQQVFDARLNDSYYELWGSICNGEYSMLIRHPYQSIHNAVRVTNHFVWFVAQIVMVLGVFVVYLISGYLTKPIKELSVVADRMAKLDFDTRYTGSDKSELGKLGQSMNEMSAKLEDTISRLKTANLELTRDLENKEKLESMRAEFLSNVSHELKTPIALVQGYAEGLREGITDDPESMAYYCDVIVDESAKMNAMVKKLLTLNQIEFGNEELVVERFNLSELVSAVVNANELRMQQKGIDVSMNIQPDVYAWCDEYKVEEVVTNYISNAINHCDGDRMIEVKVAMVGSKAKVSVYNTGKAIPDEDIARIWDKFYKVDKARTREYGGNGIGLSIVKAILDSYNCRYGVLNREKGVEFWFELDCQNK